MSGRELQDYLMTSGLFKVQSLGTSYKGFSMGKIEIDIVRYKYGEQEQCIEFTYGGSNLFACHKLKDLDFTTLYVELNKIYGFDPKFIEWSKIELRNYNIEQLL